MFQNNRGAVFLIPLPEVLGRCKLLWEKEEEGGKKEGMGARQRKRKKERRGMKEKNKRKKERKRERETRK
jgi:hypothetical protein